MSEAETGTDGISARRTDRILAAAERLFLAYGMRRTSMDDIAREAELAKGTLYLSFKSKEALFSTLAERVVARLHAQAVAAADQANGQIETIVAYLDEAVGAPARLLASSPHTAEIFDAKRVSASATMRCYQDQVLEDIANADGDDRDLAQMLVEAAHGCKMSGPLASPDFCARLRRHVETLLRGARHL